MRVGLEGSSLPFISRRDKNSALIGLQDPIHNRLYIGSYKPIDAVGVLDRLIMDRSSRSTNKYVFHVSFGSRAIPRIRCRWAWLSKTKAPKELVLYWTKECRV
jgi:hypothetical protein